MKPAKIQCQSTFFFIWSLLSSNPYLTHKGDHTLWKSKCFRSNILIEPTIQFVLKQPNQIHSCEKEPFKIQKIQEKPERLTSPWDEKFFLREKAMPRGVVFFVFMAPTRGLVIICGVLYSCLVRVPLRRTEALSKNKTSLSWSQIVTKSYPNWG